MELMDRLFAMLHLEPQVLLDHQAWMQMDGGDFVFLSKQLPIAMIFNCIALALLARRICSELVDPSGIEAFVASRLIPLDKCPGVRPIGIGEVHRRIIAKAVMSFLKPDILEASGSLQLCAGQPAGCEACSYSCNVFCFQ